MSEHVEVHDFALAKSLKGSVGALSAGAARGRAVRQPASVHQEGSRERMVASGQEGQEGP